MVPEFPEHGGGNLEEVFSGATLQQELLELALQNLAADRLAVARAALLWTEVVRVSTSKRERNQPEFAISKVINSYFYKEPDPVGARGDILYSLEPGIETARYKKTGSYSEVTKFMWALSVSENNAEILRKAKHPIPEENEIIDQLLEDVLPHGYAEA